MTTKQAEEKNYCLFNALPHTVTTSKTFLTDFTIPKKKKVRNEEEEQKNKLKNLKEVFNQFSYGENEIDGKAFAKLANDCKIVNKKCTKTDIDLIFEKLRGKGVRKITFTQFTRAIEMCAEKRDELLS